MMRHASAPNGPLDGWAGLSGDTGDDPNRSVFGTAAQWRVAAGGYANVKGLYGAKGDGVTDDTAALQAAMAGLSTYTELVFPRGEYLTSTALTVPASNRRIIFEPGAVVVPTAAINTIAILGTAPSTFVALASDAAKDTRSVAVADGSAFARGQWVFIRSQANLPDCLNAGSVNRGEWQQVAGVATNTIHFMGTLLYDYLTSDTAEISTNTGCMIENVTVEGFTLDTVTLPSGTIRGIQAQYVAGLRLLDLNIRHTRALDGADNGTGSAINLDHVQDAWVERLRIQNVGYYGLAVDNASRDIFIRDGLFSRCRHATTTLSTGAYGEPAYIYQDRLASQYSLLASFDSHDTSRHLFYDRCTSFASADDGFQIRAPFVTLDKCSVVKAAVDGIAVEVTCPGVRVLNTTVSQCVRHGMTTKNTDAVIRGGRFDTNNTGLTYWAAGITLRGGVISDCEVVNNGRLGIGWATEGDVQGPLVVDNIRAPYDATNQTFFLGYEDAKSFGFNNLDVRNSKLEGYGQYLFCILGNEALNGLPRHSGNRLITYASGAEMHGTAVLVGGTVTVSTTAVRNYGGTTGSTSRAPVRSHIKITRVTSGGTPGAIDVRTITDGTSFVITSTSGTDTSTVRWEIDH